MSTLELPPHPSPVLCRGARGEDPGAGEARVERVLDVDGHAGGHRRLHGLGVDNLRPEVSELHGLVEGHLREEKKESSIQNRNCRRKRRVQFKTERL